VAPVVNIAPYVCSLPRSLPLSAATKDGNNGPCLRHGTTTVVDWDPPTSASLCKKAHSYAGVQESIGLRLITPVTILDGR